MTSSRRYYVERNKGVYEDVGADHLNITDQNALVFSADGKFTIAYNSSQWLTVELQAEDYE